MTSTPFKPAWWLPGPHLQTLWQPLLRRRPWPDTRRERIDTPDGDFLDLDWFGPERGPIVLLLHGLSGSSSSPYIRGMQAALAARGWRSAALNFRGCGGGPNRTWRCYHSGDTLDLEHVHEHIRSRYPGERLAAIGYSLGGNVLLKWLGERGDTADVIAAAAVSVPLRLDLCASRLDRGVSRLYRNQLLRELKDYMRQKLHHLQAIGHEEEARRILALGDLRPVASFWEYDNRVVAGLYGFRNAEDYYRRCSARRFLRYIQRPTLVIQSRDDPFMTEAVLPDASELSTQVRLEVTGAGGHVGFVGGRAPWRPAFWLEQRIPAFLSGYLDG